MAGGGARAWLIRVLPLQPPPLPPPPPPLQIQLPPLQPVQQNHEYQVWVWEAGGMAGIPSSQGGEGSRTPLGEAALTTTLHSQGSRWETLGKSFPSWGCTFLLRQRD